MPKYRSSTKYATKRNYTSRDLYRRLQDLYRKIYQLQTYADSRSNRRPTGSRGSYRASSNPSYRQLESRYRHSNPSTESSPPRYASSEPHHTRERTQIDTDQIIREAENRIDLKIAPLLESIDKGLSRIEIPNNAQLENEPKDSVEIKPSASSEELKERAVEMHEFRGDFEGTGQEVEELSNIREIFAALERTEPDVDFNEPNEGLGQSFFKDVEAETGLNELTSRSEPMPELGLEYELADFLSLENELFKLEPEIELQNEIEEAGH